MILLVIDNKKLSVEKVRCYTGAAKYMEKLEKILKETEDFFYVDDAKIEGSNLFGSVKDRVARYLMETMCKIEYRLSKYCRFANF